MTTACVTLESAAPQPQAGQNTSKPLLAPSTSIEMSSRAVNFSTVVPLGRKKAPRGGGANPCTWEPRPRPWRGVEDAALATARREIDALPIADPLRTRLEPALVMLEEAIEDERERGDPHYYLSPRRECLGVPAPSTLKREYLKGPLKEQRQAALTAWFALTDALFTPVPARTSAERMQARLTHSPHSRTAHDCLHTRARIACTESSQV